MKMSNEQKRKYNRERKRKYRADAAALIAAQTITEADRSHGNATYAKVCGACAVNTDSADEIAQSLVAEFSTQLGNLRESQQACAKGSREFRQHTTAISDLGLKTSKAMQALGMLPKDVSAVTQERFDYKCEIMANGEVETRPLDFEQCVIMDEFRKAYRRAEAEGTELPKMPMFWSDKDTASFKKEIGYKDEEGFVGLPPSCEQSVDPDDE
jgi:hypothetical protein